MPDRHHDRTTLPIPDPPRENPDVLDARDPQAVFPPIEPLLPPAEAPNLGRDTASPVSDEYSAEESVFNGTVDWVQLEIDEAAAEDDHLISPEERLRVAMARQ